MKKELNVKEKIQVLMGSANEVLALYNDHIDNEQFTPELRKVMGSNIVTLSSMVEQSFNMMSLSVKDKKDREVLEKHFDVFNDLIWLNADLVEKFFVPDNQSKKMKMK